jgi:hypothetical protein
MYHMDGSWLIESIQARITGVDAAQDGCAIGTVLQIVYHRGGVLTRASGDHDIPAVRLRVLAKEGLPMRTTLLIVFVAGAGIAAAAIAMRTSSEARAAGSEPVMLGDMSQLMKDPEYRELKRAEISSRLAESGAEVANELGLTTSQLHQLIDLETNFNMGVLDSFVPSSLGHPPDHAAALASVAKQRELKSKLDADIVALLGAEKGQQFKAYVKSQPARQQVKQFQASLVVEGSPMTAEQSKSLIATIAAEQERRDSEIADFHAQLKNGAGANQTFNAIRSAELDIDEQESARIVEAASTVLSPPQLSSLQKMLADDIARSRLHLQVHFPTP